MTTNWQDRVLADGLDREAWKIARYPVIGASDAKVLAKPESVPLYLRSKLTRDIFTGNVFTETGYRWEPMILGWAGYEHNVALFHSPDEPGFAATPDGIRARTEPPFLALAEVKIKHVTPDKRTKGPTLGEWRQLAWQFRVLPEAEFIDWCWGDVPKDDPEDLLDDEPKFLRVYPDDPKIVRLQAELEPIATELLARLRASLAFEKELAA